MSSPIDPIKLDTCGCCEAELEEPGHQNPAGLSELRYRVGTHPSFLERMMARIYQWEVVSCSECSKRFVGPDRAEQIALHFRKAHPEISEAGAATKIIRQRPLERLATRSADDPAIAMMDAWAVVADVLTFYQERIVNEGFLNTSKERRSVLELARAIGYELAPGVAAETYLAFAVDDTEGAPKNARVPKGTQIQSIPAKQGALPQTFETSEDFVAYGAWNALQPRLKHPQILSTTATRVYLDGVNTGLERGDLVLLVISGTPTPKRILNVETNTNEQRTRIDFDTSLVEPSTSLELKDKATLDPTQEQIDLTQENVKTHIFEKTWNESDLQGFLTLHDWGEEDVLAYVKELVNGTFNDRTKQLFALRERVAFFGHNAPLYKSLPKEMRSDSSTPDTTKAFPYDWDTLNLSIWKDSLTNDYYDAPSKGYYDVYLDRPIKGLAERTWVVFERPSRPSNGRRSYLIADVTEASRAGFGLSVKVTGLDLTDKDDNALSNDNTDKPDTFKFRNSTAHIKSEELKLAVLPITHKLEANQKELWLDNMVLGLKESQAVALTGEEVGTDGYKRSEILILDAIQHYRGYTKLTFKEGLNYSYKRDTVTINANVVMANHGETVSQEVLGSGDGSKTHQHFTLKKKPLTYVSAPTTSGSEGTLTVRVDGVKWTQVVSLYELDGTSGSYIVRIDNDAKANVIVGDGRRGARLPTGQENVVATYRAGIGSDGEVGAGSLTLLKTRPLGIRSVTNPLKASGADDPEKLEDARVNAPLKVLTLDRVVSLQDYEDFARAFPGIGKAQAATVWDGEAEVVHVTVADANGDKVVSPLYDNLLKAIAGAREPLRKVKLASFQPLVFFVTAKVLIDDSYLWDDVKGNIEDGLTEAFSFSKRAFGQPVTAAEVLHVMHGIEGVKAVDIDKLYKTTPDTTETTGRLFNAVLDVHTARYDKTENKILPAQLLLIHKLGINLSEMTS